MRKLYSIQYLRAIAATMVVFCHNMIQAGPYGGQSLQGLSELLASGVDIFFVISGLVMWMVTSGRPQGPGTFLKHRIIRIVPIYWALSIGKTLMGHIVPSFGAHSSISLSHLVLSLLFIPHQSWQDGGIFPVITAGWTLNFEMFFYVLFAGSMLFAVRHRLAVLAVTIFALVIAGVLLHPQDAVPLTYTDPQMLEFLFGVALGAWVTEGRRIPGLTANLAMVVAGVVLFALFGPIRSVWPDSPRIVVWGIPAALIVTGTFFIEESRGIFRSRILTLIGDGSYSTYLLHGFFAIALAKVLSKLPVQPLPVLLLIIVVNVALTTVIAVSFYNIIERPVLAALRQLFSGRSERARLQPSGASSA